jgi:hypothetical protein
MKLQRSYHKEVQQIAAHCGIEGSVPLSPLTILETRCFSAGFVFIPFRGSI